MSNSPKSNVKSDEVKLGEKPRYFLPDEVEVHNKPDDIWVSYLGRVYDITSLVKEFENEDVVKPLLAHAGKDISEWFDPEKGELLKQIHPVTWCYSPLIPHGKLPHLGPIAPTISWKPPLQTPWWKDTKYMIGILSKHSRHIRIVNVLTGHEDCIKVCTEDTLRRIQERFLENNKHNNSYTWKFERKILNLDLTLEENGIHDDQEDFNYTLLPQNLYIPAILICYNDDLTED